MCCLCGGRFSYCVVGTRGLFEVLWNLECPVGLSQRKICAHFNEKNLRNLGEFSRP